MPDLDSLSIPIDYGSIEYTVTAGFLLSLLVACVVTFFHARDKFAESTATPSHDDIITRLLPKYLTTKAEYQKAFYTYVAFMLGLVVILSLLGPRFWDVEGAAAEAKPPEASSAIPLIAAFMVVGFLPSFPWIEQLEKYARRFIHERALIPRAARRVQEELGATDFDFKLLSDVARDYMFGHSVLPSDLQAQPNSLEHSWAKLTALLFRLRQIRRNDERIAGVEAGIMEAFSAEIDRLSSARNDFEDDILNYRKLQHQDPKHVDDPLQDDIAKLLRQTYVLIGCAVRLRLDTELAIVPALETFGFRWKGFTFRHGRDILVVAMLLPIIILPLAAFVAGVLRTDASSYIFPQLPGAPFEYFVSGLILYSIPLAVAHWLRTRYFTRGGLAHYIYLGLISGLTGFIGQTIWNSFSHSQVKFAVESAIPMFVLSALVGVFYALYLNAASISRLTLSMLVVMQAIMIAFLSWGAQFSVVKINKENARIARQQLETEIRALPATTVLTPDEVKKKSELEARRASAESIINDNTDKSDFYLFVALTSGLLGFSLGAFVAYENWRRQQPGMEALRPA